MAAKRRSRTKGADNGGRSAGSGWPPDPGPLTRRNALRAMAAGTAAALSGLLPPFPTRAQGRSPNRPNVVFILSDDHRWDFLSCAGHPFVETPHLDRLADQGVRFTNAFVTTSLCSPSRASFLTGMYAHTHGVRNNLTPWNDANVTFLELLKAVGYDTAFIGKWHMPGRLPRLRGVDHFVTFTAQGGQGQYWDCPLIVDGAPEPSRRPYITEELTDRALVFVERRRRNPFCLFLSHKAVHHEFSPPRDLALLYEGRKPPLPREADPWVTSTRGAIWAGTLGHLRTLYLNYARVVVALDREIGRLLRRLEELGMAQDTVIVYAGDNGYFFGEHRLVDKRWAYEEAIRIPLIVRCPGLIPDPGRQAPQMVLNIDLAPTLLELAGAAPHRVMEGESFLPILRSAAAPGRRAWLYEYFKDFPYNAPETRAVRTDRHVYMEFMGRRTPEMYDVLQDPRQRNNLMGTPQGARLLPQLKGMLEALKRGDRL